MNYCKFVHAGRVVMARNPLRDNGIVYSNPSPETLRKLGYLPLVDSPRPEEKEGYWIRASYTLGSDHILRSWSYEEGGEL